MSSIKAILITLLFLAQPSFVSANSEILDLSQYKGKVVYLDFWASWCLPCKKSFPWMQEMQSRYGSQGLQVIAVNLDENPEDADAFLKQFPVDFGGIGKEYSVDRCHDLLKAESGLPFLLNFGGDLRVSSRQKKSEILASRY